MRYVEHLNVILARLLSQYND